MSKSLICSKIREARESHANWVRRANHLIEGLPVGEDFIPLDPTECHFGQWIYDEVTQYRVVPVLNDLLSDIEHKHKRLHDIYMHIYKIYFVDTKPSWVRSLITNQRKEVSSQMRESAKMFFDELKLVSEELLKILDHFEYEVQNMTSEVLPELAAS